MKKVLLALTLALLLCVSLLGCGEKKTGADYLFDSFDGFAASLSNKKLDKLSDALEKGGECALEVADLGAIFSIIGEDVQMPTLTDLRLALMGNDTGAAAKLGVTMNGKPYALTLTADDEKAILSTDMLSKNYGISTEELLDLIQTQMPGASLSLLTDTKQFAEFEKRVEAYVELFETAVRGNVEFMTEEKGGNVTVRFALTPENTAEIVSAMYTELVGDAVVKNLLKALGADEVVDAIEDAPADEVKANVLESLTDAGFSGECTAEIVKKGNVLVSLNGKMTVDGEEGAFGFAPIENGLSYSFDAPEVKMTGSATLSDTAYRVQSEVTADGTTVSQLIEFADGVGTYSMTSPYMNFSIGMTYLLDDTSLDITVNSLTADSKTVDLTAAGVKLCISSAFTMPEMPAEYESVASYGETEWQAVLSDLLMNNPELLSLFMGG